METLTDLEAAALGCIWQTGSCTAYAIRLEFRSSPSARFSDSAGSVYPLVTRLTARGLTRARQEKQGRRNATLYHCTPAGRAALRSWLAVPDGPTQLTTWDPLRTRVLYLGLLSAAERRRWVARAEESLARHVAEIRAACQSPGLDPWVRLAHRNSLLQASARRRWLGEVRRTLGAEHSS
jgi:DNA-binding PadR family transcriptional regulator